MHPDFPMCNSEDCPSQCACFRHASSGTVPAPSQGYGSFDSFLNNCYLSPSPVLFCVHFLPALDAERRPQMIYQKLPTLYAIDAQYYFHSGSWYHYLCDVAAANPTEIWGQKPEHAQALAPAVARERVEAGWEVPGYFQSEREEQTALWERRQRWNKARAEKTPQPS